MTITSQANVESAAQEAMETAAQTRTEAAKGDIQASLKLARAVAKPAPEPKPAVTDKGLDAKA